MADKTIGGLPAAQSVDGESLFIMEQQGQAMSATGRLITQFARDSVSGYIGEAETHATAAAAAAQAAQTAAESAEQDAQDASHMAREAAAAAAAAQAAEGGAQAAQTAAESAKSAAENAAAHVEDQANRAAAEREGAEQAKNAAAAAQTAAQTAQTAAETAATQATDQATRAAQSAQSAQSAASAAVQGASDAQQSASTARQYSGNPPRPINGTWWIWNAETGLYEDTGIKSVLSIVKSYPSVDAMDTDVGNMWEGALVIIASHVGDPANSSLYVHDGAGWRYLSDLSGVEGVGIASIALTQGNHSPGTTDVYTISLTDGRTFDLPVYNGANGTGRGDVLGVSFAVVLPADRWADQRQTVQDSRFLAGEIYNYFVGPAPGSREDYLHGGVYADDVTVDGQMTFYAEADVEHSLTAYVTRLEVPNG